MAQQVSLYTNNQKLMVIDTQYGVGAEIQKVLDRQQATNNVSEIMMSTYAIMQGVALTAAKQSAQIEAVTRVFMDWIVRKERVRLIGAGRARLMGSMAGNRLCHVDVPVSTIYDISPMPPTSAGGAILSCSYSGKTPDVLQNMEKARQLNKDITIVGIASAEAQYYHSLCDYSVGLFLDERIPNPLKTFASTGEFVLGLLLDFITALAIKRLGKEIEHDDLGPTGPYGKEIMSDDLGPTGPYVSEKVA